MAIVLRSQKTSPLTFEEMDGNFTDVNGRLVTLEANHIKNVNGLTADSSNAVTLNTDNISESGSATNIWFTNARARAAISITDSGGDGSLSYNSTTGVITYVGPSASEVRAHLSATTATGVTYTAGTGVIALASIPNSSITNSTITVTGDSGSNAIDLGDTLTVTGGEGIDTSQSGDTLTIAAELATDSNKGVASFSADHFTVTSGAVVLKVDGIDDTLIDFGTGAGQVNTADLPEDPSATGSSGTMYYTDARADARIAAASIDDLSDVTLGTLTDGYGLTYNASAGRLELAELPGATGGEANRATNQAVANSVGLFKEKMGVELRFRSITGDSNIVLTQNTDDVNIALSSSPEFGNIKINSAANTIENTSTNANLILSPNGTGVVAVSGELTATTVTATNLAGTLTTAAQTNVTSVGTLNGLTIAGSQTIQMGTNRVQGVTDPVSAQDAATKNYVDGLLSSGTTIFTLQADSGSNDTVETGDTIDFEGTANEIETAVTANKITIGLPNDVTISNNLTVDGNFTVNGTTTTINATTIDVTDPIIKLARDNESSDSIDIGFLGHYYDNGPAHAGLFRDASDNKFKMFTGYGAAGDVGSATTIDTSDAGFRLATLQLEALEIGDTDNPSLHIRGSAISTVNTNQNLTLDTAGSGVIELNSITNITGDVTLKAQSDLRFADSDSSNHIGFQAPATVASNIIWTLPDDDAAVSGYALVSNAAGTLSWAAAGATVSQDETTNTNFNLYFASTTSGALTAVKYDTGVHYNPSTGIITTGELTLGATNPTVLASSGILKLKSSGTNNLYLGNASEQEATLVIEPTASGVNYGAVRGAATAANSVVQFGVDGSDTNISLGLSTKGTGNVMVGSGSLTNANPSRKLQVNPDSASKIAIGVQASGTTSTQKALIDFIASNGTGLTVMGQGASTSEEFRFDTVTGYEFATGSASHASGTVRMSIDNTGTVTATTFSGALSGNATTATTATNVTTTDNTATNETVYIAFVDGTSGAQGIEVDSTGLTYNPSTNTLTTSVFSGTATQAQYADLAERYLPDAEYPFGTVMTVGGGAEVTYCTQDSMPVGVISTAPAYLMNSELEGGVAVALVGRVPVRVVGSVVKGQVVYADHDGVASATAEGERVGIALETNDDAGEKLVECVLKV